MSTILTVTQEFIRLFKREVCESAVLVAADDVFEVKDTPSVILQGPVLTENVRRRTQARLIEKNVPDLSYEECRAPRLYHLDFDIVATTATEAELLALQESIARLYQAHPVIEIGDKGSLNLTELVPVGGLRRVNLSNLRQASGRARVEDCPVYDGEVRHGKLIRDRVFDFQDGVQAMRTFQPHEGESEQ